MDSDPTEAGLRPGCPFNVFHARGEEGRGEQQGNLRNEDSGVDSSMRPLRVFLARCRSDDRFVFKLPAHGHQDAALAGWLAVSSRTFIERRNNRLLPVSTFL